MMNIDFKKALNAFISLVTVNEGYRVQEITHRMTSGDFHQVCVQRKLSKRGWKDIGHMEIRVKDGDVMGVDYDAARRASWVRQCVQKAMEAATPEGAIPVPIVYARGSAILAPATEAPEAPTTKDDDMMVQAALERAHIAGGNAAEAWAGTTLELTGQGRVCGNPYRCGALARAYDAGFIDTMEGVQFCRRA